jgi:hypothetical protein
MNMNEVKEGGVYRVKDWDGDRPSHWNTRGEMDKWCGKVITVSIVKHSRIRISEDKQKWLWSCNDFEHVHEAWDSPKRGPINPNKAFRALKRG